MKASEAEQGALGNPAALDEPAERIRVGFIVGPTGTGKSRLAMQIAERLGGAIEIVNADSRQFYRGMDIGTAKPSREDRRRTAHHLIDVRDPDEPRARSGRAA